ncbi:Nramp family divalent metal transporter [Sinomicrobium weinanense]|uniref:Nramp family divalent metal transporter n=1 Tax=Sinomicrobium weinanense TaxID=2842200 RepID=A0A926JRS4_9FLAO|nr:Nramp family divalent metal transporter [Sinomicrobium weinanense]MBC9796098.1 Nramp family divalent metal transporter [Sinomicrobium weinanense]MBU3124767.1 Nramp family divalent metal transporter [Sinomicrobium weinanense]
MYKYIKTLGPGLLFAGAAIGVSHLVQSTRAGADFDFGLLWALLLVHLFKYPFFRYGPEYTMATGECLLDGYKKLGRPILIAYFILTFATMFTIQTALTVVTAGLASTLFGITTDTVLWSAIITAVCMVILLIGRYKLLDNLMKIIVLTLTISTCITVVLAVPDTTVSHTFEQVLPKSAAGMAFLIAYMGWMPAPLDISIWHSLWALEKKKTIPDYSVKNSISDFNLGFGSTIILGFLFMALGGLVMFGSGEIFSTNATLFSEQLISLYTRNLGEAAYIFIAIAAFTTMFSTTLTTLDASPRAMSYTTKLLLGQKDRQYYALWMAILATGTIAILLFFLSEMKTLIDIATILSFVTAPFYAIINFRLICSSHTPKQYRPGILMKIVSWLGIIFLVGFSLWYIITLF